MLDPERHRSEPPPPYAAFGIAGQPPQAVAGCLRLGRSLIL